VTGIVTPDTKSASGDTRKACTLATSSGRPNRPSEISASVTWRISSGMPTSCPGCFAAVIRVSMNPGATALTLIPNGPSSRASVLVVAAIAPFAAV